MKIKEKASIICGGFNICKNNNIFPCVDCFHKIYEKGDLNPYYGEVIE